MQPHAFLVTLPNTLNIAGGTMICFGKNKEKLNPCANICSQKIVSIDCKMCRRFFFVPTMLNPSELHFPFVLRDLLTVEELRLKNNLNTVPI